MNRNKIIIVIFSSLLLFLTSCQSAKNIITGKSKTNADEFLVKKKNPLILPPDIDQLPVPKSEQEEAYKTLENDNKKIKKLLGETSKEKTSENDNSLENSILKTLKNN